MAQAGRSQVEAQIPGSLYLGAHQFTETYRTAPVDFMSMSSAATCHRGKQSQFALIYSVISCKWKEERENGKAEQICSGTGVSFTDTPASVTFKFSREHPCFLFDF